MKSTATLVLASTVYPDDMDYCKDSFIIAVDGGYNHLKNSEYIPNYTVGDMDSIARVPGCGNILTLPTKKDDTDTACALKLAVSLGYDKIFLIGGTGQRISHTMANLSLLGRYAQKHIRIFLVGEREIAFAVHNTPVEFTGTEKGYFSVFAFNDSVKNVTIRNAAYTLNGSELHNTYPLGVSNEFIENKKALVSSEGGTLLIVIPRDSKDKLMQIQ